MSHTVQHTPPPPAHITPGLIREHGLTPDEYQKIVDTLGRIPSLTELGIFSVMWSEHCSYKSSRVHLRRLPTESPRVVQGPGENAGIIDVGDGWACAFKIESHNHPSYIEPFQGAATGVGGILRDIFTMGARPLAVMDSLRFGPIAASATHRAAHAADGNAATPHDDATGTDTNIIHRNHAILEGVVSGIAFYGNCFGVPNLGGETRFEPCYSGNPLVNAFALGLVRHDAIFYARAGGVGNPVIYVGAKTGRDGIHGATMASEEFKEGSEQKRPNVQVGDPFLEKLLLEACLEAMQTGAIVGIQDMGAAGLTCSTCEMGGRGGLGIQIELDRVPQREQGMNSYEIMLSESQERMLLVAEKGREHEVFRVFEKWGLDAVTVGEVVRDNRLRVFHHGALVADIPNTALTDDAPVYHRPVGAWQAPVPAEPPVPLGAARDWQADLLALLAAPNLCSKRWIHEQYDSMVQTNTVFGPGGDGGLMRIKGTRRALAMALDGNGRWAYLDPRLGAMHAVAEAARNVSCTGALPVAATNNLNFGNPEKPEIMAQFSQAVDGIAEACTALETPITGGNVSLYNETLGEAIHPTPVLGIVGLLDDVDRRCGSDYRAPGRALLLLQPPSAIDPARLAREFGSSEYAKSILGRLWGAPPSLDLAAEKRLQACVRSLIHDGLLDSAHDLSDGGLAVTALESGFTPGLGVRLELPSHGLPPELVLFGETASRILLSCDPAHVPGIQKRAADAGLDALPVGETTSGAVALVLDGETLVSGSIDALRRPWRTALEDMLRSGDPMSDIREAGDPHVSFGAPYLNPVEPA